MSETGLPNRWPDLCHVNAGHLAPNSVALKRTIGFDAPFQGEEPLAAGDFPNRLYRYVERISPNPQPHRRNLEPLFPLFPSRPQSPDRSHLGDSTAKGIDLHALSNRSISSALKTSQLQPLSRIVPVASASPPAIFPFETAVRPPPAISPVPFRVPSGLPLFKHPLPKIVNPSPALPTDAEYLSSALLLESIDSLPTKTSRFSLAYVGLLERIAPAKTPHPSVQNSHTLRDTGAMLLVHSRELIVCLMALAAFSAAVCGMLEQELRSSEAVQLDSVMKPWAPLGAKLMALLPAIVEAGNMLASASRSFEEVLSAKRLGLTLIRGGHSISTPGASRLDLLEDLTPHPPASPSSQSYHRTPPPEIAILHSTRHELAETYLAIATSFMALFSPRMPSDLSRVDLSELQSLKAQWGQLSEAIARAGQVVPALGGGISKALQKHGLLDFAQAEQLRRGIGNGKRTEEAGVERATLSCQTKWG